VRLWDVATDQRIGAALAAGPGPVTSVAFSPDSKILATAGPDGGTRLWHVFLPHHPADHVCAIIHYALTRTQWKTAWRTYIPSRPPFLPTCQQ